MMDDSVVEQRALNEWNDLRLAAGLARPVRALLCWFHVMQTWQR